MSSRLQDWGYEGQATESIARVVSAHGDYFHLICAEKPEGEALARTKASAFRDMPKPITGDFVRFKYNPQGESRITELLPRFSLLERLDPSSSGMRAQTLAVNFDTLFFAMAVNGNASSARLERMLALAEQSDCRSRVVVLLTKCDLEDSKDLVQEFSSFDVPVLAISSRTGEGMAAVREYVKPRKTVAVVGSSGVGKSSLVNALAGEEWMATGEIQEWSGKGRHTTTSRELVMLPCGAMALDTPGLRELGIFGMDGFELKGRLGGTHRFRAKG
jgi:ribosome biogenesis GTPase